MIDGRFIDIDGVKIRYRDTGGAGPVALFTHGIGGSLEFWSRQMESLGGQARLIAWDMPGHGLSDPGQQPYGPDSFAAFGWRFLGGLGVERACLVGNSLGAAVSLRMAGLQSSRVLSLLLANAATLGRENPLPFRLMTLPVLGGLMMKPGPAAIKQQITAIVSDPASVDDQLREAIARNVHKPGGAEAFIATLKLMGGLGGQSAALVSQSHDLLSRLKMPVLFVHGSKDSVIPAAHSVAAARLVPQSSLKILDDCGHTPQVEKPDAFNRLLSTLLAGPGG